MRLVGAAVPRKRQREELPLSDQLLVGRLQLGLDASAKKSQISRKHLQIVREGERWFVRRLAANPAKLRRVDGGGDIDIGGAGKPTSEAVELRPGGTLPCLPRLPRSPCLSVAALRGRSHLAGVRRDAGEVRPDSHPGGGRRAPSSGC